MVENWAVRLAALKAARLAGDSVERMAVNWAEYLVGKTAGQKERHLVEMKAALSARTSADLSVALRAVQKAVR